jgi:hypothetical protein
MGIWRAKPSGRIHPTDLVKHTKASQSSVVAADAFFSVSVNGSLKASPQATSTATAGLTTRGNITLAASAVASASVPMAWPGYLPLSIDLASSATVTADIQLARGVDSGDSYWPYVVMLLKGEGTDAGTTFTDSSPYNKTAISQTNATTSVAQFQFGASSIALASGAAGTGITFPSSPDYEIGSDSYTIEFWIRPTSYANANNYIFQRFGSFSSKESNSLVMSSTGVLTWSLQINDAAATVNVSTGGTVPLNVWTHVALVVNRTATSPGLFMYVNGAQSYGFSGDINWLQTGFDGNNFYIGAGPGTTTTTFVGNIDEFRITKGIARYTGAFAVPTATFPTSIGVNNLAAAVGVSNSRTTLAAALENFGTTSKRLGANAQAVASVNSDIKFPIFLAASAFAGMRGLTFTLNALIDRATPVLGGPFFLAETTPAEIYPLPVSGFTVLAANAAASATTTADLSIPSAMAVTAVATATATANLGQSVPLTATSGAVSAFTAALTTASTLSMSINALAESVSIGSLSIGVKLAATAVATSTVSGGVVPVVALATAASSAASATGGVAYGVVLDVNILGSAQASAAAASKFLLSTAPAASSTFVGDPFAKYVTLFIKNSGSIYDSSDYARTLTTFGGPFGVGTELVAGMGNAIVVPASADGTVHGIAALIDTTLDVQTGDFAIDFWYRSDLLALGAQPVMSGRDITIATSLDGFITYTSSGLSLTGTTPVSIDRPSHVAVTRAGTTIRIFVGGALDATGTDSVKSGVTGNAYVTFGGPYFSFQGATFSAARVTTGVPRFIASFDPTRLLTPLRSDTPLAAAASSALTAVSGLAGIAAVTVAAVSAASSALSATLLRDPVLASGASAVATSTSDLSSVAGTAQVIASDATASSTATASLLRDPRLTAAAGASASLTPTTGAFGKPLAADAAAVSAFAPTIARPIFLASDITSVSTGTMTLSGSLGTFASSAFSVATLTAPLAAGPHLDQLAADIAAVASATSATALTVGLSATAQATSTVDAPMDNHGVVPLAAAMVSTATVTGTAASSTALTATATATATSVAAVNQKVNMLAAPAAVASAASSSLKLASTLAAAMLSQAAATGDVNKGVVHSLAASPSATSTVDTSMTKGVAMTGQGSAQSSSAAAAFIQVLMDTTAVAVSSVGTVVAIGKAMASSALAVAALTPLMGVSGQGRDPRRVIIVNAESTTLVVPALTTRIEVAPEHRTLSAITSEHRTLASITG